MRAKHDWRVVRLYFWLLTTLIKRMLTRMSTEGECVVWTVAWHAVQAARRAPAAPVPQGYKITEEQHVAAVKVLHRAAGVDGLPQRMLDAMLAAAPQPPEAAPVVLPEYGIDTANHAGIRVRGYTEQQVRELLANHGIQERST